jgi:hypothetical protein
LCSPVIVLIDWFVFPSEENSTKSGARPAPGDSEESGYKPKLVASSTSVSSLSSGSQTKVTPNRDGRSGSNKDNMGKKPSTSAESEKAKDYGKGTVHQY